MAKVPSPSSIRAGRLRAIPWLAVALIVILLLQHRSPAADDGSRGRRRLWGFRDNDPPLRLGDFFSPPPWGGPERPTCRQLASRFQAAGTVQHEYCLRHHGQQQQQLMADVEEVELDGPSGERLPFMVYKADDAVSRHVRKRGSWEAGLLGQLMEAMDRASAFHGGLPRHQLAMLDVGANVGVHTAWMQAAGYKVVAFEPMEANEQVLRRNLCLHDPHQQRVVLFTRGLGAQPGRCRMYSHMHNRGNGVVDCSEDGLPPHHLRYMRPRGQMEVTTLDDALLCRDEGPLPWRFGAMKIDVEGFESQVLEGGREFLRQSRVPFVMLEWVEEGNPPRREGELQGMLDLMYGLGYLASTSGFFAQDLGRWPLEAVSTGRTMFFVLSEIAADASSSASSAA